MVFRLWFFELAVIGHCFASESMSGFDLGGSKKRCFQVLQIVMTRCSSRFYSGHGVVPG